jgi:hypothetical protein
VSVESIRDNKSKKVRYRKRQHRNEHANLAKASQFLYMQIGKQNGYVNFRPEVLILSFLPFLPVLPNFRFFGRITEVRPENKFFLERAECSATFGKFLNW